MFSRPISSIVSIFTQIQKLDLIRLTEKIADAAKISERALPCPCSYDILLCEKIADAAKISRRMERCNTKDGNI
jgi:hypothetical protein